MGRVTTPPVSVLTAAGDGILYSSLLVLINMANWLPHPVFHPATTTTTTPTLKRE